MKKTFTILLLLLITAVYAGAPSFQKRMNILVYPFKFDGNKQYSWVAAGLTDTVISDLNKIKDVSVFSDEDRKKAVKEMELGMTGLFDEKTVVQIGSIMGANIIFTGNIQINGNKIRVNAKLMNVETTKVENSIKLDGTVEGIFELQDKVVYGLMTETEKINIADIKPVIFGDDDKKKIDEAYKPKKEAYEWYVKGLEIEDINPKTALSYFKKAIDIDENYTDAMKKTGHTAGCTFNLFDEGLKYFTKADKIYQKRNETETNQYADLMNGIGEVYSSKEQHDLALKYYMKAITIEDKLGLQNTIGYADLMKNIGVVYGSKGQLDLALEYSMKAITIEDKLGLQNTISYANLMNSIGVVYGCKGKFDLALEYFMKAKTIKDKPGLQNTATYAALMNNIGVFYGVKGQLDLALEYYMKTKTIDDKLGLQNTSAYSVLMSSIGGVYGSKGQLDLALEYYMKAKTIDDKLGLQNAAGYATLMWWFATIYEKQGKTKLAGEHYRNAYNIYKKAGYIGSEKETVRKNAERLGY